MLLELSLRSGSSVGHCDELMSGMISLNSSFSRGRGGSRGACEKCAYSSAIAAGFGLESMKSSNRPKSWQATVEDGNASYDTATLQQG
jgi:hypothetical protein